MNPISSNVPRLCAAIAVALGLALGFAMTAPAMAQDITQFAIPSEDGEHYKINYDALEKTDLLTPEERFMVAAALRRGDGYLASGFEKINGLKAKCKVEKIIGIPDGVECKVSADPFAVAVLSTLSNNALSTAICLVIDADDDEITEPFCTIVIDRIIAKTIDPVINLCAQRNETADLSFEFKLIPPKVKGKAKCEKAQG